MPKDTAQPAEDIYF